MRFSEYMKFCDSVEQVDRVKVIGGLLDPEAHQLLHGALGVAGEAGEIVELVKKQIFYEKPYTQQILRMKLTEELGDLFWYATRIMRSMKLDISDILGYNVSKLKERYPLGRFDAEHAIKKHDKQSSPAGPSIGQKEPGDSKR